MLGIKVAFCFAIFLLFYVYFGYPLLLSPIALLRKKTAKTQELFEPAVSPVIAAHNEEAVIGEKIENSLQLDYPRDKLGVTVFSDASADRTDEIVKSYADQGVKLLCIEGRKTYCQDEAIKIA